VYTKRDDGRWIEVTGFVRRLLSDDDDGSRHQRFIIDIGGGWIRYRRKAFK
jgi:hypothetical protein